jgi:hypothetical protein
LLAPEVVQYTRSTPPRPVQRTTGAFFELLKRNSFEDAVFVVQKSAVVQNKLTSEEAVVIFNAFKPLVLDVEARNRVKRVSLVPMSVVVAACGVFGRCAQTVALLKALNQLPRVWALQLEQEALQSRLATDYLLEDELAEAEEEEPMHLAAELSVMAPFLADETDEEASKSWQLERVPLALEAELEAFQAYRADALNIRRKGAAVAPATMQNDRATCLRFLGWLSAERSIQPGLGVFAVAETAEWAEEYVKALHAKGLQWSSLSNYSNSLVTVCAYVYSAFPIDMSVLALEVTPLDQLARLRSQCEGQAVQQKLFARKDPNFLDWGDANRARAKAEAAFRAATGKRQILLLRDWLLASLLTCMPPDRVGERRLPPRSTRRSPRQTRIKRPHPSPRRSTSAQGSSGSCGSAIPCSARAAASRSTARRSALTRPRKRTARASRAFRQSSPRCSSCTSSSSSSMPSMTQHRTFFTRRTTRGAA